MTVYTGRVTEAVYMAVYGLCTRHHQMKESCVPPGHFATTSSRRMLASHTACTLIVWTPLRFTNTSSFFVGVCIGKWVQSISPIVFGNPAMALKARLLSVSACWFTGNVIVQSVGQLAQCISVTPVMTRLTLA